MKEPQASDYNDEALRVAAQLRELAPVLAQLVLRADDEASMVLLSAISAVANEGKAAERSMHVAYGMD